MTRASCSSQHYGGLIFISYGHLPSQMAEVTDELARRGCRLARRAAHADFFLQDIRRGVLAQHTSELLGSMSGAFCQGRAAGGEMPFPPIITAMLAYYG